MTEATGDSLATDPAMSLAAFRGNQVEASALIEATARTSCDGVKVSG